MDLKIIGLQIKHFRQVRGFTQKQLADKIGTTWEMVSRYETGKSSPLGRIDAIAKALNVPVYKLIDSTAVMEEQTSYSRNVVPLIDKKFSSLEKALDATKKYYSAPDWIIQKYPAAFAIDTSILKIKTAQVENEGIVYASPEKPDKPTDIVVAKINDLLALASFSSLGRKAKVMAIVIAWEKRFK